jgi:hypothetical protein
MIFRRLPKHIDHLGYMKMFGDPNRDNPEMMYEPAW